MSRLANRSILVVGASSGIGLAAAQAFAREGARVALAARRRERLEDAVKEIGERTLAVVCDACDIGACRRAVAKTAEAFDGISDLVYTAGIAKVTPLAEASADDFREIFDVNVLGPSNVTQAALPHLARARGRALYVSSIITDDHPPRRGMGMYSTTKAALNRLVECWQSEEPAVSFTRVSVGDTLATEFASDWDLKEIMPYVEEWNARGYLAGRYMTPEDVALHLVGLLEGPEGVPVSYITPRLPDPES